MSDDSDVPERDLSSGDCIERCTAFPSRCRIACRDDDQATDRDVAMLFKQIQSKYNVSNVHQCTLIKVCVNDRHAITLTSRQWGSCHKRTARFHRAKNATRC